MITAETPFWVTSEITLAVSCLSTLIGIEKVSFIVLLIYLLEVHLSIPYLNPDLVGKEPILLKVTGFRRRWKLIGQFQFVRGLYLVESDPRPIRPDRFWP